MMDESSVWGISFMQAFPKGLTAEFMRLNQYIAEGWIFKPGILDFPLLL